jgi:hypothetical protein
MNKKGVELSMNLIIIAAIGLLILVILAVLVINAGGKTVTGMKSCNVLGGTCEASCGTREPLNGDCSNTQSRPNCCKISLT